MAVPRKRSKRSLSLTPLELRIMQALWEVGPASVKVVRQALCPTSVLAYTSVQTVLNILQRKGKVKRTLQGGAYLYHPVVSQEKVTVAMLQDIIHRMFGGSAEQLVLTLIENNLADPARICELTRQFAANRVNS
jgi:predicted transcriptional regulator